MAGEQRGLDGFGELLGRVGVGAHAALLQDDVPLGVDDLVGEHEAGHAVGLESHQGAEVLLRDTLEVCGVIV